MEKILLVDDDSDLLLVLEHALNAHGYCVTTLANAANTVDTVKTIRPAIVVLDIGMGDWDGRKICACIKAEPGCAHIPVILYSGLEEDAFTIADCRADLFLQKPLSTSYFLHKIDSFTRNHAMKH